MARKSKQPGEIPRVGGGLRQRLELAIAFANDPGTHARIFNGKRRGSLFGFDIAGELRDCDPPVLPAASGPPARTHAELQQVATDLRELKAWRRQSRLICFLPAGLIKRPAPLAQEFRDGFGKLVDFFSAPEDADGLRWLREEIQRRRLPWQFYPRSGSDRRPESYSVVPAPRSIRDVPLTLLTLAVMEGYGPLIMRCEHCLKFALGKRRRPRRFCGPDCATKWHNAHNKDRFTKSRKKSREVRKRQEEARRRAGRV